MNWIANHTDTIEVIADRTNGEPSLLARFTVEAENIPTYSSVNATTLVNEMFGFVLTLSEDEARTYKVGSDDSEREFALALFSQAGLDFADGAGLCISGVEIVEA